MNESWISGDNIAYRSSSGVTPFKCSLKASVCQSTVRANTHRGEPSRVCGPDVVTMADDSLNVPGLLVGGVLSGSRVRIAGTSVAAALFTRLLHHHM